MASIGSLETTTFAVAAEEESTSLLFVLELLRFGAVFLAFGFFSSAALSLSVFLPLFFGGSVAASAGVAAAVRAAAMVAAVVAMGRTGLGILPMILAGIFSIAASCRSFFVPREAPDMLTVDLDMFVVLNGSFWFLAIVDLWLFRQVKGLDFMILDSESCSES